MNKHEELMSEDKEIQDELRRKLVSREITGKEFHKQQELWSKEFREKLSAIINSKT